MLVVTRHRYSPKHGGRKSWGCVVIVFPINVCFPMNGRLSARGAYKNYRLAIHGPVWLNACYSSKASIRESDSLSAWTNKNRKHNSLQRQQAVCSAVVQSEIFITLGRI
jgi:hypothetical protein